MAALPALVENWFTSIRLQQVAPLDLQGKVLVRADGSLTKEGAGALAGLLSALLSIILYKASRFYTPFISKTYKTLSLTDQRNWDTRISSNIHAVLCVVFGYELLVATDFFWKEGPEPMILRTSVLSNVAMGISFGYFLVDFVCCVKYNMGGAEMILHHFGSLMAVATALWTGNGHLHTSWMLVTEFTTPLINNRWWLEKMGLRTHILYVINGLGILVSWVFARILVFPPFFYVVYKYRQQIPLIMPLSQFLLLVVPVILTCLNLFWFSKIVKGAAKVLLGSKSKED